MQASKTHWSNNDKIMFLEDYIGNTPLVTLQRMDPASENHISLKLEGNNPAGSVKDRPAYSMIKYAEERGEIKSGDTLLEATSGNTGIALAMVAATKGYHLVLIMPDNMSYERQMAMRAYGAEIILVSKEAGMIGARDLAGSMQAKGKGKLLDQFANPDNPRAHYETTGPEIWQQTGQSMTHFVSSMGTTGTIMGCSRYFKEQNPDINIIGVQPEDGATIPGIRRWPEEYLPRIYSPDRVDQIIDVSQQEAEETTRLLASQEGIFCGISSGGALSAALQVSQQVIDAHIVTVICDRGDRYLSTNVFSVA
jgi:cysteine synthase B